MQPLVAGERLEVLRVDEVDHAVGLRHERAANLVLVDDVVGVVLPVGTCRRVVGDLDRGARDEPLGLGVEHEDGGPHQRAAGTPPIDKQLEIRYDLLVRYVDVPLSVTSRIHRLLAVCLNSGGVKISCGHAGHGHSVPVHTGPVEQEVVELEPSSTKNRDRARDPEAHQAKKGNNWHHGNKAHVGADRDSGLVHTVVATAANVADIVERGSA